MTKRQTRGKRWMVMCLGTGSGKRGSDRALDNLLVRGSGGTDPPGASPATPEESDDTDTSAGEGSSDTDTSPGTPPSTPEEPDRFLPYDRRSTVSHPAATSSIAEWVQNIETTPSSRSRWYRRTCGRKFRFLLIHIRPKLGDKWDDYRFLSN